MVTWDIRLQRALKQKGWSLAELARRSGIELENVKKYHQGIVKQPRGNTVPRLAGALGLNPIWLRDGVGPQYLRIPLIGYASGGDSWTPIDDHAQGAGLDDVEFDMSGTDPVAIAVRGSSMTPVYRAGDYLICSRVGSLESSAFLRRDCVVQTLGGECYIKLVMKGSEPGLFRLRSYNHDFTDIEDVELAWAAPVVWIRRNG